MFAQINHMAMVSPIYPMLAKFYEAYFGLKPSGKTSRPLNAVTVGDGYVGLNINPLRDGYVGGLDHFGMLVEDLDKVMELDEALTRLEQLDERQARMIEQRYFGGLPLEEIAGAMGVSLATVKRDLRSARAWLAVELSDRDVS